MTKAGGWAGLVTAGVRVVCVVRRRHQLHLQADGPAGPAARLNRARRSSTVASPCLSTWFCANATVPHRVNAVKWSRTSVFTNARGRGPSAGVPVRTRLTGNLELLARQGARDERCGLDADPGCGEATAPIAARSTIRPRSSSVSSTPGASARTRPTPPPRRRRRRLRDAPPSCRRPRAGPRPPRRSRSYRDGPAAVQRGVGASGDRARAVVDERDPIAMAPHARVVAEVRSAVPLVVTSAHKPPASTASAR